MALFGSNLASAAESVSDTELAKTVRRLHARSILVDGHNDITGMMADAGYDLGEPSAGLFHTDLDRLERGGVTAQFFSIYIDAAKYATNGAAARAMTLIDAIHRAVEMHPKRLALATRVADIRRAKRDGRVAALLGIEGGYAIESSLELLRGFHRLGVRYMTLTHSRPTGWAGSSAKGPGLPLTEFGREVVREMNRLGMLVDVSHVSDATMADVLDVARAPVIASHSSARALCDSPRNIPDDLLRRIAANRGVVMVNFYNAFLDTNYANAVKPMYPKMDAIWEKHGKDFRTARREEATLAATLPTVPLARVADHIDHIVRVAGIDHVGLGSDYDGVESVPQGLEDVSCFPNLTAELLRRGYAERDVRKILGENFLRAFAEAERYAAAARD